MDFLWRLGLPWPWINSSSSYFHNSTSLRAFTFSDAVEFVLEWVDFITLLNPWLLQASRLFFRIVSTWLLSNCSYLGMFVCLFFCFLHALLTTTRLLLDLQHLECKKKESSVNFLKINAIQSNIFLWNKPSLSDSYSVSLLICLSSWCVYLEIACIIERTKAVLRSFVPSHVVLTAKRE